MVNQGHQRLTEVFAGRLKQARKEAGLSQKALADALGLSRDSVKKWEMGISSPEFSRLDQLVEITGKVAAWFFLSDNGETQSPAVSDNGEMNTDALLRQLVEENQALRGTVEKVLEENREIRQELHQLTRAILELASASPGPLQVPEEEEGVA